MLIKTLLLFVLTFAISTASLVNTVRDVFVVEAEAAQVGEAFVLTAEAAQVQTEEAAPTIVVEETLAEETTVTQETFVDKTVATEEMLVEETVEAEETQAQDEVTEPVEEVSNVQTTTEPYEEEEPTEETTPETEPEEVVKDEQYWINFWANLHYGELTAFAGHIEDGPAGPNGNDGYETWYNKPMGRIVEMLDEYFEQKGLIDGCDYNYEYWEDKERGLKMYGPYIICAGDVKNTRERYTILECSLGTAIVADHCVEAELYRPYQLDIAVTWR